MTRAITALLECIGRRPGLPNQHTVAGFTELDWQELVDSARRHRLSALLYHRLRVHDLAGHLPADAAAALRSDARLAAMRGLRLQAELSAVGEAFHQAGIPVIILKGGYLASQVYEDIALRWMGDLDLLVHRPDVERALTVLSDRGYRARGEFSLDVAFAAHHHVAPLSKAGCTIEVHWSVVLPDEPFAIDLAALWSRSLQVSSRAPGMRALGVNDLLVHLCVHAACNHNLLFGLQPLVDIVEVCCSRQIDWTALQEVAVDSQVARPVSLMLQLAREMLGARVPALTDTGWHMERCDADLVAIAKDDLITGTIGPLSPNILQLGRLRGNLQRLTTAVTTSLAPVRVAHIYGLELNSWRMPLFQAWRAWDVLRRHGPVLWRLGADHGPLREAAQKRARLNGWLRGSDDLSHLR